MDIVHELRTDIGGTSRRTEELMGRAAARIERLEAERDIVLKSFEDACDAIGCPYDNEALLMAIAALAGKSNT